MTKVVDVSSTLHPGDRVAFRNARSIVGTVQARLPGDPLGGVGVIWDNDHRRVTHPRDRFVRLDVAVGDATEAVMRRFKVTTVTGEEFAYQCEAFSGHEDAVSLSMRDSGSTVFLKCPGGTLVNLAHVVSMEPLG